MRTLVNVKLIVSERDSYYPGSLDEFYRRFDISGEEYEKQIGKMYDFVGRDLIATRPQKIFWEGYTGGDISNWLGLAAYGSRNFKILKSLSDKGGVLIPTESGDPWVNRWDMGIPRVDQGIARVVETNLQAGETGVLAMTAAHDVAAYLKNSGIKIRQIDYAQPLLDWLESMLPAHIISDSDQSFRRWMTNNFRFSFQNDLSY